jgi:glucose/arabinose dehydrogenase
MRRILPALLGGLVLMGGACYALLPVNLSGMGELGEPLAVPSLQERIQLPEGFSIDYYAQGIRKARFMRFMPNGDLLVSSPDEGAIFLAERDADGDGRADNVRKIMTDLDWPHGIDLFDGWLYIAEQGRVLRVRYDAAERQLSGEREVVVPDLPPGGNHRTRTLRFGPDRKMYVTIGSTCNACQEQDPRRAAMVRYEPDGSNPKLYATGLRNSVGFDWQPGTGDLYATDNGRDLLGDDLPPCELNRIVEGGFYGWPFANGNRMPDPDLGAGQDERIRTSLPPAHGFVAHTAPLGIAFYRGKLFPERYRGAAFVAQHGSWNRRTLSGYRVVMLEFAEAGIRESDFAVGFENDQGVIGRPVDLLEGADGALYLSDDYAGVVYRISYTG